MIGEALRNLFAFLATWPFLLLPARMRFRAVLRAAHLLAPLAGRFFLYRAPNACGGRVDETMRIFLKGLARIGARFDPEVVADVPDDFAIEGAIFLSAHFPINGIFTRWLHDRGARVTLIRETPGRLRYWGVDAEIDLVEPSRTVLLYMRTKIEEGFAATMAISPARPHWRSVETGTRFGPTSVATSVFPFAQRLGVPVYFFGVRATRGLPVLTVRPTEPTPEAFIAELRRFADEMLPDGAIRRGGIRPSS